MRVKPTKQHFTKTILSAAVAVSSSLVFAQDKPLVIEEVVVTAQKRTESLQDAPIAISAFTEDTLEQIGATSATDISDFTPNATITPSLGSSYNIRMTIRGLGTAEPSLAIDPKVGIYLDGAYIARNAGSVFDVVDLERIEVLRGPQGTLWGKNTTGGAINMVTTKPKGEFGFKQQLSGGDYGYYRSVTTIDTPTYANVSSKLTYVLKGQDGWAENTNPVSEKELGSEDTEAYRIAVRWEPLETLSLDYSYDRTNGEATPIPTQPGEVSPYELPAAAVDSSTGAFFAGVDTYADLASIANGKDRLDKFHLDNMGTEHVDISGHNLTLSWVLGEMEIKSITAYRDYESYFGMQDLDGGTFTAESGGETVALPIFHTQGTKSQHQFSEEIQFIGSALDTQLNYVVGLYHFDEKGKEINPWVLTNNIYRDDYSVWLNVVLYDILGAYYETESESNAIYGQFTYDATDQWAVTLGMRYTEDEKELTLLADDPMLTNDASDDESWNEFTSAITVAYQLNDDINLYGKIAEGYASGVFNPGTVDRGADDEGGMVAPALKPADPEETTAYELGMKSMLLDSRLQLNAAVFYNDNTNLQVTEFVNGVRVTHNSGESESTGVEFDLVALAAEGLMIMASYGYIDTDNKDKQFLQLSPKNTGSLGVQYDYPVDMGLLTARFDTTYSDDFGFSATDKSVAAQSRTLLNARLSLSEVEVANGNFKVALWGRNLTDKEYIVHGANFGSFTGYTWGAPRTTGVDLAWEY